MAHAWRQYTALAWLLTCATFYESGFLTDLLHRMRHGDRIPSDPFTVQIATRTIGSGPLSGDEILAIDGHAFTAMHQLDKAVARSYPGDKLHLVLSKPSGTAFETDVVLQSENVSDFPSAANTAIVVCLYVVVPLVCLGLGFGAAFIRARDPNAWLLLLLLIGFSGLAGSPDWHRSFPDLSFAWGAFANATWAFWMMLFAINFPSRFGPDRRFPWVKYLILVPAVVVELAFWAIVWGWNRDISATMQWRPLFGRLYMLRLVIQMVVVAIFFTVLGFKSGTGSSPDERRRLRILWRGASIALAPTLLAVLYSLLTDRDVFGGVPWPLEVTALCMLALFPITLAYVIVVERAMDLSIVIRQGVKYALAKGVVRVFRIGAIVVFVTLLGDRPKGWTTAAYLPILGIGILGLVVFRQNMTTRASTWVDRKFFREAYDAERVLSELAVEAGRYVEIDPLLETVAQRISDTLHVTDIVILVREGNVYRTRYSTRLGQPMDIAANSRLLTAPGEQDAPLEVYFDKPQPWIRTLDAEEIQTLSYMHSELLLALRGRGSEQGLVIGIMSLGPKKSQEPYSKTDMRLLQAIAVQMGMALQNSRLAASLAEETAHREVMNRELEIAREVQERLFPQRVPKIAGIDCFGYCRPARGVGGDYYDLIELGNGRVGIAIGDVSGKGIAAALLMASLQASLRGQTMAGVRDLAELMRNVNKLVYDASQSNRYATFFYGEFDSATKQFAYVNAGHNAPVLLRGEEVIRLEACGPVVGLLPGAMYEMETCRMQAADIFVGYTDGISEAMNESDEEWEEERFIAAARTVSSRSAKEMVEGIFSKADQFTGPAKQYDDMTLLVMKLTG